jgi:hypothetical protein
MAFDGNGRHRTKITVAPIGRDIMEFFHEFSDAVPVYVAYDMMIPDKGIYPQPVAVGWADLYRCRIRLKFFVLFDDGDAERVLSI